MLSKEELVNIFFIKEKNNKFNYSLYRTLDKDDIRRYSLDNFYADSLSLLETYNRLRYNLDIVPCCPTCGKKLKFVISKNRFLNHCSIKCAANDNATKDKYKLTCISKYGVDNYLKTEDCKKRIKETCLIKYGITSPLLNGELREKGLKTKLLKYGSLTYNNSKLSILTCKYRYNKGRNYEKARDTMLNRYGVNSFLSSDIISQMRNNVDIQCKIQLSKRLNHSFNTSKLEIESFEILNNKFEKVYTLFKSEKYPFNCDFYIPELDLYIECNYHWTHGGHPFDEANIEDKNKLGYWKSKNNKFYNNAIKTWTNRDVMKRLIVRLNNINYLEIWNIDELKEFINKQN